MDTDTAFEHPQEFILIVPVKCAAFDGCHKSIHQQIRFIIDTFIYRTHGNLLHSAMAIRYFSEDVFQNPGNSQILPKNNEFYTLIIYENLFKEKSEALCSSGFAFIMIILILCFCLLLSKACFDLRIDLIQVTEK